MSAKPDHKAPQPRTAVSFELPAGAADCRPHMRRDPTAFPWSRDAPMRALFSQPAAWAPDAAVGPKILVDNPARLYQF